MSDKIPPLFKHQIDSVNFMSTRDRVFDTSDPGTGKTRVQIELFKSRRLRGGGKALVIAPKSLLRSAWQDDFNRFAPELITSVATANNREKALYHTDADVYITNTDAVKWLAEQKPAVFKQFDTLIIDEMSTFKHKQSKRSKALAKLKKHFKYRYGLTGTPNTQSITDLWHQVFILDDGKRLGTSFYGFRGSVCTPVQVGPQPNMLQWQDRPGAELAVANLLSDMTIRHKFEDCIDIPENFQHTCHYYMGPAQSKAYMQMERVAVAQIGSELVNAVNAASVATKLMQIASGAVYSEDGYSLVDTGRYELVADLVEERANSVVFYNWVHQRDELIKEFQSRGITFTVIDGGVSDAHRKEAVDHFQAGFYRVLMAHPASAAHGLTLTRGTATIWASPTYNLEHFLQGNRRIYRAGQTQRTETIVVVAPGTIEEKVIDKLTAKNTRQISMLELLQDLRDAP